MTTAYLFFSLVILHFFALIFLVLYKVRKGDPKPEEQKERVVDQYSEWE